MRDSDLKYFGEKHVRSIDLLENSILWGKNGSRVITMQSQRTFIAAISVIMLRLTIFLEIMKALNEEMTI